MCNLDARLADRGEEWEINRVCRGRHGRSGHGAALGRRGVSVVRNRAIAVTVTLMAWPALVGAQTSLATEGYFRVVSEHFGVSFEEVRILGEWRLSVDEIPVVLFVAARAGVSPDAVATLRGDGQAWDDVARNFDVGAADFHVALPVDVAPGKLTRAYEEFTSRPRGTWNAIHLRDQEIITLVNIHFLSVRLRVSPARVLEAAERSNTFVAAHRALGGP